MIYMNSAIGNLTGLQILLKKMFPDDRNHDLQVRYQKMLRMHISMININI